MKILLVCLRFPFPPSDGGTIAMFNMANALRKAGAEVKILSFNTKKHFIDLAKVPIDFMNNYKPEAVFLDATVKPISAFFNLFGSTSYNISRFDIPEFHHALREILKKEKFDVIQLESLFVTPYLQTIRNNSDAKIVLRAHNVEYVIWERLASTTKNPVKKWYLELLTTKLKKYELTTVKEVDAIVVLTDEDHAIIKNSGCETPVLVSPIGLDVDTYPVSNVTAKSLSVFHLGSMDWLPNIEAVEWFLDQVFPMIKEKNPNIKIYLAGKSMSDEFLNLSSDQLVISGRVDDSRSFMNDKAIMIVPLLSGGGMRVKIIEGLALGKTIISTTIGAEGIKYTDGKNILIADSPVDFYKAIVKCANDLDFCAKIGAEARLLAQEIFENKIIGKSIIGFYQNTILKN